jgi:hypothetical protein
MNVRKLISKKRYIPVLAWLNIVVALCWGGAFVVALLFLMFQKTLVLSGSDGPTTIYMTSRMTYGSLLLYSSLMFSFLVNGLLLINGVLLLKFRTTKG